MRFAYLIMAHNSIEQLLLLLKLLDSANNDIYLHIDKKAGNIDESLIKKSVAFSSLKIYRTYNVNWGDISQSECQMFLLEQAIQTKHDYYHLLSGHDLPLHSNKVIDDFFHRHKGKEFIHFESDEYTLKSGGRYYILGRGVIARWLKSLQKRLGINRKLYCGANWYSITHGLACEFVNNKKLMLNMVRFTISSDEYILQTFYRKVAKGHYELYKKTVDEYDHSSVTRCIDWYRGNPYVWREKDFDELIKSGNMYARKFDDKIDGEIIKKITWFIKQENEGKSNVNLKTQEAK